MEIMNKDIEKQFRVKKKKIKTLKKIIKFIENGINKFDQIFFLFKSFYHRIAKMINHLLINNSRIVISK